MWINIFDVTSINDPPLENPLVGEAWLFDNVYMLVEVKDSYGNVTVRSGGQDGVAHWLNKNGMKLSWKALKQGNPDSDLKFKMQMAMGPPIKQELSGGIGLTVEPVNRWAINENSIKGLNQKIGMLKPKIYNKIYVVVVDGDIAAFMTMEKFQNSAYGITDYQGGGHNFWIPFMMSGGRSGAGYIMTVDLPPLQAELFVDALKKQKGSKYSEIASYVFSHASMSPLPEFQDRISWAGSRIEEIVNEDGSEHPEANQKMFSEMQRKIKNKDSDVFDKSKTLEGGYVVDGKEYEWPTP